MIKPEGRNSKKFIQGLLAASFTFIPYRLISTGEVMLCKIPTIITPVKTQIRDRMKPISQSIVVKLTVNGHDKIRINGHEKPAQIASI